MRQVMLYKGEDGYWIAECPSLPGWYNVSSLHTALQVLLLLGAAEGPGQG